MGLIEEIIEKAKAYLLEPVAAFDKEKNTEMGDAFKYLLVLSIVYAVLYGIVGMATISMLGPMFGSLGGAGLVMIPGFYVGIIIGAIVGALILHIFAYLVGAKNGLNQTFKLTFYAMTPVLLLGWIPYIGGLASLWALVLEYFGLKSLQGLSSGKAVLAIVLPLIIIGGLTLVAGVIFATSMLAMAPMMGGLG